MSVGEKILEQLGGSMFIGMTGCHHFVTDKNSLLMQIPKNESKANRLKITLQSNDLYTMNFFKYVPPRKKRNSFEYTEDKIIPVKELTDVYCDQLETIFTQVTGMYTRLF